MHLLCLSLVLVTSWSFSYSATAPALNLKWVKGHFEHFAAGTAEHSFPYKETSCPKPADCEDLRISGYNTSGIYAIWPRSRLLASNSVRVYCDMTTNGGGWTVIQRRGNYGSPEDYFFEDWDYYKRGFGSLERDFWLGNDNIYSLTNQGAYEIRFELTHTNGTSAHAQYKTFWIDNEEQKYKLNIKGYSGNAGNSMSHHNGMKFSTKDKLNGPSSGSDATKHKGGWWYISGTHYSNLNGLYKPNKTVTEADGISWYYFGGDNNCLQSSEMKIRPSFK